MKNMEINGHAINLRDLRTSKKGVKVIGARVHVAGLGTVYVQVYPPAPTGGYTCVSC